MWAADTECISRRLAEDVNQISWRDNRAEVIHRNEEPAGTNLRRYSTI